MKGDKVVFTEELAKWIIKNNDFKSNVSKLWRHRGYIPKQYVSDISYVYVWEFIIANEMEKEINLAEGYGDDFVEFLKTQRMREKDDDGNDHTDAYVRFVILGRYADFKKKHSTNNKD